MLKIFRFKKVDSTNSAAFRYAEKEEAPSGSVFVADYQTDGRGKWGRKWESPQGKNLLFSILKRPKLTAAQAPLLTQTVCRSVAKVLKEKYDLPLTFKRPNDLLVRGKKICGVLIEAKGRANGHLEALAIGVGLNVNATAKELVPGATSLLEETGKKQSRLTLLDDLLVRLNSDLKGVE